MAPLTALQVNAHIFCYATETVPANLPVGVKATSLPREPAAAVMAVERVLLDETIDVLGFWDLRIGPVPWASIGRFRSSLDDVWHPGARVTGTDEPDLLRYVLPLWKYRPDPAPELVNGINWKLSFRAAFVRASVVRKVGGLDREFSTLGAVALDLGLRLIQGGAICRQQPDLVSGGRVELERVPLVDRYRLLGRHYGRKWLGYTLVRRLMEQNPFGPELRAWREAGPPRAAATPAVGALHRELGGVRVPDRPSVSVVLPTFGRYRYVAEVLDDLRAQTIRPIQIIIADGNAPADRQPQVYERYSDLPLEVIWHEEPGTCSGRNACLQRTRGDFVWFVDDDSRFDSRNLESHLRVMIAYGADVSVGPAYTRSRPELHGNQREVICTFVDCGTTLCKRSALETVGGFDMQYNRWLLGEDGELGIRIVRAGGLVVNNPSAKRFHYLAPVGGSRSPASVHRFDRWSLLPRPAQSIYYTARRYFERGAAWDAMVQGAVLYGWRKKESQPATRRWRIRTLVGELAAIPLTAWRLRRSVQLGREMVATGPRIPTIEPADHVRAGAR